MFTLAGLWLQNFMPGVDFLAPGLILCLQEEKPRIAVMLGAVWLLLQEGMGSLAFGSMVLWYGVLTALFFFGQAKNFVFMMILGASLGVLHFGIMHVMPYLQEWRVLPGRVFMESVFQAVVFPVQWGLLYVIYNHLPQDAQNV